MKFAKWAKTVFCAVFMLMLVLPLIFTNFKPGIVSTIENRTLKSFPALYSNDGEQNKNFITEFEGWFSDNVGFREEMFTANAALQYNLFCSSASSRVVTGRDGWLFYTGDNNLEIAAGEYPNFDENILADICQKQQRIQKALAAQGIEYVIILPPSKVSIYPEYLCGNFKVCQTPVDILADYLEANSDLKVIRLKQVLLENKEANGKLLYYKTDTHWNAYGTYIGYCEIVRKLNEWEIIDSKPVEVDFVEAAALRDLKKMIVSNNEKYYENGVISVNIHEPKATEVKEGEKYADISNYMADKQLLYADYYLNPNKSLPSFLVLGDSMFMSGPLPKLFAEHSSEMAAIWTFNLSQELVDIADPDVVFFEMTERVLSMMGTQSNTFFQSMVTIQQDGSYIDIYYSDYGFLPQIWFPIWSEEDGQDDLGWYQAERLDENTWHVQIDLSVHQSKGIYNVHVYQGNNEPAEFIMACTYEVEDF